MAVAVILLLFLILLSLIAWKKTAYWSKKGINGPKSIPFLGVIHKLVSINDPPVFLYKKWTQIYGKVYGIQKGWINVLVISDEKMVNEMLNTKFQYFHERSTPPIRGNVDKQKLVNVFRARGIRWKRLRTVANPVFSVQNIKRVRNLNRYFTVFIY